jgi:hypothetical protein
MQKLGGEDLLQNSGCKIKKGWETIFKEISCEDWRWTKLRQNWNEKRILVLAVLNLRDMLSQCLFDCLKLRRSYRSCKL